MLKVKLDFDDGVVVPDNKALEFIKKWYDYSITNSEYFEIFIGTEVMFDALRVLIVRGVINVDKIEVRGKNNHIVVLNKYGQVDNWNEVPSVGGFFIEEIIYAGTKRIKK